MLANIVSGLAKFFADPMGVIKELWKDVMEFFKANIADAIKFIGELWNGITTTIGKAWDGIVTIIKDFWNTVRGDWGLILWKAIGVWLTIKDFAYDIWTGIFTKAKEIWGSIKDFAIDNVWAPIKTIVDAVWKTTTDIWDTIINGLKTIIEKALPGQQFPPNPSSPSSPNAPAQRSIGGFANQLNPFGGNFGGGNTQTNNNVFNFYIQHGLTKEEAADEALKMINSKFGIQGAINPFH